MDAAAMRVAHDNDVLDVEVFNSVFNGALITEQGFEACVTAGTNAATFLITNKSPGLQCKRIAGSTLESQQATTSVLGFWAFSSDSKYCLSFKK